MKVHSYAELFPLLTGAEFDALVASIRADGLLEPVWLYEGAILDGRNRARACEAAGVEVATREYTGTDPLGFVVAQNLHRRHLNETQRSFIGAKLANLGVGRPKETVGIPTISQESAAKMLNVSRSSVNEANRVIEKAAPEVVAACEAGALRLNTAVKLAAEPPEAQRAALAVTGGDKSKDRAVRKAVLDAKRAVIPADVPEAGDRYMLRRARLDERAIDAGSVDWIITDPPYGAEHLDVYDDLATFALHALRPGGGLLVMTGQAFLPDVLTRLQRHLRYNWTLAYRTPGGQAAQAWGRAVQSLWKPLLWFTIGERPTVWVSDEVTSASNDKGHHHWGQSEDGMAAIVEKFTFPGQMICDPCCGGGTTGAVAVRLGRRFVGLDADAGAIRETAARLQALGEAA